MQTSTLYKTDGTITTVTPKTDEHYELKELQTFVNGYIQFLYSADGNTVAVVNEEGRLRGLPLNPSSWDICKQLGFHHDLRLVGDILVAPYSQV